MIDALVPNCALCRLYFEEKAHLLIRACATTGIEHGMSTREVLGRHMAALHVEHEGQPRPGAPGCGVEGFQ